MVELVSGRSGISGFIVYNRLHYFLLFESGGAGKPDHLAQMRKRLNHSVTYLVKGHPPSADIRYTEEDIIRPSTLNLLP